MFDASSASISLPPHVEGAMQAGVSLPEGRPGTEHANWRQDANFQVEQIAPEYRLTVYERVLQWEKRLATIRGACVACVFPDGYESAWAGANRGRALITQDSNETQKTYSDFAEVVNGAVECPPEGEADLIIVGAPPSHLWQIMTTQPCVRGCPSVNSSRQRITP